MEMGNQGRARWYTSYVLLAKCFTKVLRGGEGKEAEAKRR